MHNWPELSFKATKTRFDHARKDLTYPFTTFDKVAAAGALIDPFGVYSIVYRSFGLPNYFCIFWFILKLIDVFICAVFGYESRCFLPSFTKARRMACVGRRDGRERNIWVRWAILVGVIKTVDARKRNLWRQWRPLRSRESDVWWGCRHTIIGRLHYYSPQIQDYKSSNHWLHIGWYKIRLLFPMQDKLSSSFN